MNRQSFSGDSSLTVDLAVIGTGMAGLSAAVFALDRGLTVALMGKTGSIHFATGLMDLMGVYPAEREWENPWQGLDHLRSRMPESPFSRVPNPEIEQALDTIQAFLAAQGLGYERRQDRNVEIITSLGTIKKSYMIPRTMWPGVDALKKRLPTLLVDFTGLKIVSTAQMVSVLKADWPALTSCTIDFPGMEHLEEVYPEHLARHLDIPENCRELAGRIAPCLQGHKAVGIPALLGMYRSAEVVEMLSGLLGVSVFEIPTPPVSVPGIRLQDALMKGLNQNDALHSLPEMVKEVNRLQTGGFILTTRSSSRENRVKADAVILATGRFLGRGLTAERTGIRETLMDIPVVQPSRREAWHRTHLFNPKGHPVNSAGIEVDTNQRPVSPEGNLFCPDLFAAGSILAHCDWTRQKCGSGMAVATAYGAVTAFCKRYE